MIAQAARAREQMQAGMKDTMQVLVVDDDAMQRHILASLLKRHGYEVFAVSNGAEAWDILQSSTISMVFTDWVMPGMSGPELIGKIRSARLSRYVYIILCTQRSSRPDLVEGMRSGSDDFLVKPVHEDELLVRVSAGERVLQLEKRLEEDNRRLEEAHRSLSKAYETIHADLNAAAQMQRSLLPQGARIHGVRFESLFCPATMVAGDIFNFFSLNEDTVGFYLLDVSGHGIPAAMLAVTLSKMLSTSPVGLLKRRISEPPQHEIIPPHLAVMELNRRFQDDSGMYFTMIYGLLAGPGCRCLSLAQAGHPHPIYLRKGAPPVTIGQGGVPIGILPEVEYDLVEEELSSGDRLFLISDGVLECVNPADERFGLDRVKKFTDEHRGCDLRELLTSLQTTLQEWVNSEEFEDDVSVMALEIG